MCPFSKTTVMGSPLGPMSPLPSHTFGFSLQYEECISSHCVCLKSYHKSVGYPSNVVPVGIPCLASQYCIIQGAQLGKTINTFSPTQQVLALWTLNSRKLPIQFPLGFSVFSGQGVWCFGNIVLPSNPGWATKSNTIILLFGEPVGPLWSITYKNISCTWLWNFPTNMHVVTTILEAKNSMNLKEDRKHYMRGFGGRKLKRGMF